MSAIKIHPSNLFCLGGCMVAIIAVFLVAIFPNIGMLRDADEEIKTLNEKVKTQELLYPVYLQLLAEVTHKIPTKLQLPKNQKIANNGLGLVNKTFMEMATKNNVSFVSAIPDAKNYLEDMGFLSINVIFEGDFFDFRPLLLDICRLPYLESVDEMRIETINEQKRISFRIKVAQQ